MGFWYRFISFLLHPRLGLNLLKNSEGSLPSNPLKGKEKERQRDWKENHGIFSQCSDWDYV